MKKAILIYGPTPIFGGQLGANKQDIFSAFFGLGNNKKLIEQVTTEIATNNLTWQFDFDSTESNADEIFQQKNDLVVVLPGLEKKFDSGQLSTDKIIQLTTSEYQKNDTTRIIAYMKK